MTKIIFTIVSPGGADLVLPAAPREHLYRPATVIRVERVLLGELLHSAADDNAMLSLTPNPGWSAPTLHHHAAVHRQDLAGNVFCLRCGEEGDRGRDIFTFAEFA